MGVAFRVGENNSHFLRILRLTMFAVSAILNQRKGDTDMTFIAALEVLKNTNNEAAAWEIAQQDEGINEGVTLAQWVAFARATIAREEAEALAYSGARNHG
jgi:hypothetical protein